LDLRLIRDKEEKQDYRYMPEPNLPPLRLAYLNLEPSKFISRIPTLPEDERSHLIKQYQLDLKTVLQLMVSDKLKNILIELNIDIILYSFKKGGGSHQYFKQVMELNPKLSPKRVSSLLLTDLLAILNDCGRKIDSW
jgi:aspartyl-tRNA(Asn)/glutamyl-tRNA(Gln) amidotransferase subunit B